MVILVYLDSEVGVVGIFPRIQDRIAMRGEVLPLLDGQVGRRVIPPVPLLLEVLPQQLPVLDLRLLLLQLHRVLAFPQQILFLLINNGIF